MTIKEKEKLEPKSYELQREYRERLLLWVVTEYPEKSYDEIAMLAANHNGIENMRLSKESIVRTMKRLELKGQIEAIVDKEDARRWLWRAA